MSNMPATALKTKLSLSVGIRKKCPSMIEFLRKLWQFARPFAPSAGNGLGALAAGLEIRHPTDNPESPATAGR